MLTSLHDEDFITASYEMLLGRPADDSGTAYYLARLRTGYSKLSILQQLLSSAESQHRSHNILGLDKMLARYRLSQRPVIGVLFRRWWNLEGESVQEHFQRMMINELACIRQQLQQGVAQATVIASSRTSQAYREPARVPGNSAFVEQLSPKARAIFDSLVA
jgi:hypothetical protein